MSFLPPSATGSPPRPLLSTDADGTHPSAAPLPAPRHRAMVKLDWRVGTVTLGRLHRRHVTQVPSGVKSGGGPPTLCVAFSTLEALSSPFFRPPSPPRPLSYPLAAVGGGGAGHLAAGVSARPGGTEVWPPALLRRSLASRAAARASGPLPAPWRSSTAAGGDLPGWGG